MYNNIYIYTVIFKNELENKFKIMEYSKLYFEKNVNYNFIAKQTILK